MLRSRNSYFVIKANHIMISRDCIVVPCDSCIIYTIQEIQSQDLVCMNVLDQGSLCQMTHLLTWRWWGLRPMLQPATRGRSRLCSFTFGRCHAIHLYTVFSQWSGHVQVVD